MDLDAPPCLSPGQRRPSYPPSLPCIRRRLDLKSRLSGLEPQLHQPHQLYDLGPITSSLRLQFPHLHNEEGDGTYLRGSGQGP